MSFFEEPFDEYEGALGGLRLQSELLNPLEIPFRDLLERPNIENLIRTAYLPTMSYASLRLWTYVLGEPMVGFWTRQGARFHDFRNVASGGVRVLPALGIAAGAATFVAAGTAVNEMTRRIIGHGYTTPFTSGFGTVV